MLHELRSEGRSGAARGVVPQQRLPEHKPRLPRRQRVRSVLPAHPQGSAQRPRGVQGGHREQTGDGRVLHGARCQRYRNRLRHVVLCLEEKTDIFITVFTVVFITE